MNDALRATTVHLVREQKAGVDHAGPVWPLTSARPQLADVIADATRFPDGQPQILTPHRRPVVVVAITLVDLPPDGEHIEIDAFLREGGTTTLKHEQGHALAA